MYASRKPSPKGFIALLSVLILGFVFLVAVVSAAALGLSGRLLLLTLEDKARSEGYAEACAHAARILVANDPDAERAGEVLSYDDLSCTLVSLEAGTPSSGQSTVKSRASVDGATTNFLVVLDSDTADVISWKEYADMP